MRLIDADELEYEVTVTKDGKVINIVTDDEIDKMPTVEAEPIKHGHWIKPTVISGRAFDLRHCSYCNGVPCGVTDDTKYCAICGARMDEEVKE